MNPLPRLDPLKPGQEPKSWNIEGLAIAAAPAAAPPTAHNPVSIWEEFEAPKSWVTIFLAAALAVTLAATCGLLMMGRLL